WLLAAFSRLVERKNRLLDHRGRVSRIVASDLSGKGDPPMLVLRRKENEKVLFPNLGIAVQILRVAGGKARLGIEAPQDVSVVRHEIASEDQLAEFAQRLNCTTAANNHALRNQMHTVLLGLCLVQKQLEFN